MEIIWYENNREYRITFTNSEIKLKKVGCLFNSNTAEKIAEGHEDYMT